MVTKPPYEHLPGFPSRESVTTETSETSSEASISTYQTTERTDSSVSSQSLTAPVQNQKRMSNKEKRFQLRKDDGSYSELKPISPHDAQRQFGDSLRLNPVGPAFEAQATANDPETVTAHNAVPNKSSVSKQGFMGSYYVLEVGQFNSEQLNTIHVSPPPVPDEEGYFMLDPQQLMQESSTQGKAGGVSSVGNGQEQNRSSSSLQRYENVECSGVKKSSEGLYDTPRNVRYLKAAATQNHASGQSSSSSISPPLTYENVQPEKTAQDASGQLSESSNQKDRANSTASSYENIELTSSQQNGSNARHLQAGAPEDGVIQQNRTPEPVTATNDRLHTSENGDAACSQEKRVNLPEERQTEFDITSSQAPVEDTSKSTNGEKKRKTRREEIYEPISLGAKNSGEQVNPLQHQEPPHDSQGTLQMNGFHGNKEAAVGSEGLTLTVPGSNSDVKSQAAQKEHRLSTGSTKIVENSEDPFAGLVISASRQLEEGEGVFDQSEPGSRGRAETIWDDDRVELEWSQVGSLPHSLSPSSLPFLSSPPLSLHHHFTSLFTSPLSSPPLSLHHHFTSLCNPLPLNFTLLPLSPLFPLPSLSPSLPSLTHFSQIDTLLENMSGSLPTSPPLSPVAKEVSLPSNQSGNLFRWLLGLGLGGYASTLESNGFDNLTFLVRSVSSSSCHANWLLLQ